MTEKKSPVHLIIAAVHLSLVFATLLPTGTASKACLLGYNALCSFTPISTIGLLALCGLHLFLHQRAAVKARA